MLYKAISAEQNGDRLVAPTYYKWAMAFDGSALWPQTRKILREFPLHPASAYEECAGMVALVLKSWPIQLAMVFHLFLWLRNAGVFLALGAYIVLLLTYAPSALHWISDRFPTSVPQSAWIRSVFACAIVCFIRNPAVFMGDFLFFFAFSPKKKARYSWPPAWPGLSCTRSP